MHQIARHIVLLIILVSLGGCASWGWGEAKQTATRLDDNTKQRIHTWFLNSPLDVPRLGRLDEVANFVRHQGFTNTDFVGSTNVEKIANEIRDIRRRDRNAKFVLVGWSGASLYCWDIADLVARDGIVIDRIIYLDSEWLVKRLQERPHPRNVRRVLCLYREGHDAPTTLPNAQRITVPTTQHMAVAKNPETVRLVVQELVNLGYGL